MIINVRNKNCVLCENPGLLPWCPFPLFLLDMQILPGCFNLNHAVGPSCFPAAICLTSNSKHKRTCPLSVLGPMHHHY